MRSKGKPWLAERFAGGAVTELKMDHSSRVIRGSRLLIASQPVVTSAVIENDSPVVSRGLQTGRQASLFSQRATRKQGYTTTCPLLPQQSSS